MAKRPATRNREETLNRIYSECIELSSEVGLDGLRAEEIAKRCKISRPLLNHYFPDDLKASLRQFLIARVLEDFRAYIDKSLEGLTDPDQVLETYVKSHFEWARRKRAHFSVLLSFFPQCVNDADLRKANTQSVEAGLRRIELLLAYRVKKKAAIPALARSFQIFLTGAIISHFTENDGANRASNPEQLVMKYLNSF